MRCCCGILIRAPWDGPDQRLLQFWWITSCPSVTNCCTAKSCWASGSLLRHIIMCLSGVFVVLDVQLAFDHYVLPTISASPMAFENILPVNARLQRGAGIIFESCVSFSVSKESKEEELSALLIMYNTAPFETPADAITQRWMKRQNNDIKEEGEKKRCSEMVKYPTVENGRISPTTIWHEPNKVRKKNGKKRWIMKMKGME